MDEDDLAQFTKEPQGAPSFSLGNYWIISSYIMGVFLLPFALAVSMMAQVSQETGFLAQASLFAAFLTLYCALTMLISAFGMQCRQIWGIYFAYAFLATEFLIGLFIIGYATLSFQPNEPPAYSWIKIAIGAGCMLLALLWWRYFASKRALFE